MSALIGEVRHPHHNSPVAGSVWVDPNGARLVLDKAVQDEGVPHVARVTLDPIAARNLAALLVRAADECERMRAKQ